ncbi:unnamed protein product [Anisakis simplex]|uniref:Uncharacterized protein n=1 Tax=Anisakis simplex TaxID=6269 RepID=A0A3P6PC09_ANISI|nr:unnamed protein product [Anisakis simplex]
MQTALMRTLHECGLHFVGAALVRTLHECHAASPLTQLISALNDQRVRPAIRQRKKDTLSTTQQKPMHNASDGF